MNDLRFKVSRAKNDDGSVYDCLEIFIDGESLIDLVRNWEKPFAQREGHPALAGNYEWLPANKETYLALQDAEVDDEKTALLECQCGCPGCWPLLVNIRKEAETVIWRAFEQPHRSEESAAGFWNYVGFGPFVFERQTYEKLFDETA